MDEGCDGGDLVLPGGHIRFTVKVGGLGFAKEITITGEK